MSDLKFKNEYDWCKIGSYQRAKKVQALSYLQWIPIYLGITWRVVLVLIASLPCILRRCVIFFLPIVPKDITGEIALVTGSGNGLGRSIALALVKRGAKLAIVDLDHEAAKRTAEEARAIAGNDNAAKVFVADVSSKEDVKKLKIDVTKEFGAPVSILVNNAGLIPTVSLTNGTDEQIQKIIDVNLTSHFWMLRTFLPEMKERNHGHVVTIASITAIKGIKRAVAYSTTKFGLRGMNQALSWELSDDGYDGIHVSTACPYFIATKQQLVDMIEFTRPNDGVGRWLPSSEIPFIDPDVCGESVVQGMLTNQSEFTIPSHFGYLMRLSMGFLPEAVERKIVKVLGNELIDRQ